MKDLFSGVSDIYAASRPGYPESLIEHILSYVAQRNIAWDVATGNGQVAGLLSPYFNEIIATDISDQQVSKAIQKENIKYKIEPAEHSSNADNSVNLVTIGQAIHWFDFDAFYKEVKRVMVPGGIIAVIGYGLIQIDKDVDDAIQHLYANILDNYWDPERKYIDDLYKEIPFPFEELPFPDYHISYQWTLAQLMNYFNTWSAITNYKKRNSKDPLEGFAPMITKAWGKDKTKEVSFPIFGRMGRVGLEL